MNNLEDYCTIEQSKILKEKGFPLFEFHYNDSLFNYYGTFPNFGDSKKDEYYICPTLYQVKKWLLKEKDIHISFISEKQYEKGFKFAYRLVFGGSWRNKVSFSWIDQEGDFINGPEIVLSMAIDRALTLI